jgi:hypothetical protein
VEQFRPGKKRARMPYKRLPGIRHTFWLRRNFSQIDFFTSSCPEVSLDYSALMASIGSIAKMRVVANQAGTRAAARSRIDAIMHFDIQIEACHRDSKLLAKLQSRLFDHKSLFFKLVTQIRGFQGAACMTGFQHALIAFTPPSRGSLICQRRRTTVRSLQAIFLLSRAEQKLR